MNLNDKKNRNLCTGRGLEVRVTVEGIFPMESRRNLYSGMDFRITQTNEEIKDGLDLFFIYDRKR